MIRTATAAAIAVAALGGCGEPPATSDASARPEPAAAPPLPVEGIDAPWRCAAAVAGVEPAAPSIPSWRREGGVVAADPPRAKLIVAAVAQARGTAIDARPLLRDLGADVVLALGGMGTTTEELRRSLGTLVDPAWLLVAIPGDSESWPALRTAIAELSAAGAAVVAGGPAQLIDGGAAVIGVVPGERHRERLAAGIQGCLHDSADRRRLLDRLAAKAGARPQILAAVDAPQGTDSDLAPGGIHAGDGELAGLLQKANVDVVVHAPVGAKVVATGRAGRHRRAALAAGSLDPMAQLHLDSGRSSGAGVLAITVARSGTTWRFVRFEPM